MNLPVAVPKAANNKYSISHTTYSALVQNNADLVGHVAYALYKRDKLKFCESFEVKHSRAASEDELSAFIHTCNLEARLNGYRAEAEKLLETMAEFQLEEAVKEIDRQKTEELARKLSESKSWLRSIAEAIVGSIVVALIWGALIFAVYANKFGPDRVFKDVMDDNSKPVLQKPQ